MTATGTSEPPRLAVVVIDDSLMERPGVPGRLDYNVMDSVVTSVASAVTRGWRLVLVASGAEVAGASVERSLKFVARHHRRHILAALGYPRLLEFYRFLFDGLSLRIGQVLVTRASFADRKQYLLLRETLGGLLGNGAVPIVSSAETAPSEASPRFESNHQLSAFLGGMLNATVVVALSEESGVRVRIRSTGLTEELGRVALPDLERRLRSEEVELVQPSGRQWLSVSAAGRVLSALGIPLILAGGRENDPVASALDGREGRTVFETEERDPVRGVRKWLCLGAVPQGTVVASPIGARSLRGSEQRGSLLAAGIVRVEGDFKKDDVIEVVDESGQLVGYGVSRYGSRELLELRGAEDVIVIHADYFFGIPVGV